MKKVLIIDDHVELLWVLKKGLEKANFDVVIMPDIDVIELTKNYKPDIIFIDILLSSYDGRSISQKLKRQEETKHIPVILISGLPNAQTEVAAAKADGFLAKPFSIAELVAKIKETI